MLCPLDPAKREIDPTESDDAVSSRVNAVEIENALASRPAESRFKAVTIRAWRARS
jgi:hypothetical protein